MIRRLDKLWFRLLGSGCYALGGACAARGALPPGDACAASGGMLAWQKAHLN